MSLHRSAIETSPHSGITVVSLAFLLASAYLFIAGALMLFAPGLVGMAAGAALLSGLEVAGPYMFLLVGVRNLGPAS
jgi:hypothetical protein